MRRHFRVVVFISIALGLVGCNQEKFVQNWIESTSKLRVTAKQQGDIVPYRQEQFMALKAYFMEINEMALRLKTDAEFAKRFNAVALQSDLNAACEKVFIKRSEWELIVERCTRNSFFLCAEEVRAYREMVIAIRGVLQSDQQVRFDQAPSCQIIY